MYSQKTPLNQTVVFSMLDSRTSSLVETSRSWSTGDYLVRVQALIMYQIIRLFDGDIRQRANAERDLLTVEACKCQLTSMNNYRNETESAYQQWSFRESTRRTALMSILVQATYSLNKDGYCTSIPFMAKLPVSAMADYGTPPKRYGGRTRLDLEAA